MVRPPKPGGRDRTRSISLDGDVSEIAENLARKNQLSRTLSELLRKAYGFPSEAEKAKASLFEATSRRKAAAIEEEEALKHYERLLEVERQAEDAIQEALAADRAQETADIKRKIEAKRTWLTHADDTAKLVKEIQLLEAELHALEG